MLPVELKNDIKGRTSAYINWLRQIYISNLWPKNKLVHPRWDFVFKPYYRTLNFHPGIKDQVVDLLSGKVADMVEGESQSKKHPKKHLQNGSKL